jgi:hypothetical protein
MIRNFINIVETGLSEAPVDIEQVASQLNFLPTHKKDLTYSPIQQSVDQTNIDQMPALTFGKSSQQFMLQTVTEDGHETQNAVAVGDVIVSGPSKEKYNIGGEAKLLKNYPVDAGNGRRKPDISAVRMVAKYTGAATVNFVAPWGKQMVLKPGDFLVKEDEGKYYRIAAFEYNQTYNPPGK